MLSMCLKDPFKLLYATELVECRCKNAHLIFKVSALCQIVEAHCLTGVCHWRIKYNIQVFKTLLTLLYVNIWWPFHSKFNLLAQDWTQILHTAPIQFDILQYTVNGAYWSLFSLNDISGIQITDKAFNAERKGNKELSLLFPDYTVSTAVSKTEFIPKS